MKIAVFIISMISCFHSTISQEIVFALNPDILSSKLRELMEISLKASEIQKHFDSFTFVEEDFGENEISEIIEAIGNRFKDQADVLKNSYSAVLSAYANKAKLNESTGCCKIKETKFSHHFGSEVHEEKACYMTYSNMPPDSVVPSIETISNAFKENVKNYPFTEWQDFVSEDSIYMVYPAIPYSGCSFTSSIVFRFHFAQSYVERNFKLVFVIDSSNVTNFNIKGTKLKLKDPITWGFQWILGSIDNYDKIAFVAFNDDVQTFGGPDSHLSCLNRTFTRGAGNAESASSLIAKRKIQGGRNYTKAILKAFEFFHQDYQQGLYNEDSHPVMMFLSVGEPDDSRELILETLRRENEKINNSVTVFTYGFGNANFSVLEDMAKNSKIGHFASHNHIVNIQKELMYFYKQLPGYNGTEPIWWHPGYSTYSGEQKIQAALPVDVNNARVGMLLTSFSVKDMLLKARIFRPNDFSYAFVIHKSGLLLQHPFYPIETTARVIHVDVTVVERDPEFLSVYESMKRGENGNKTFVSTKFVRTGIDRANSVKKIRLLTKYIWKRVPNLPFSVCLALSLNNTYVVSTTNKSVPPGTFLHDRMDLVPPKQPCTHQLPSKPLGSKNQSSVSLSVGAFKRAEDYIYTNFTKQDILDIANFMEGTGPNTFNITDEAKRDVFMTYKAEELWLNEEEKHEALKKNVARRFIGTRNGVFRIFPAAPVPKFFDSVGRPWYTAAQAYPNKTVMTLPYEAAGDKGLVRYITLCKTIHINRTGSKMQREIVGVMAAAFHVDYFYSIVRDLYSFWINSEDYRIYIIDTGGYIIVTKEYFNDTKILHLTEREPQISSLLIQENIFKRTLCSRFELGTWQRQYLVEFPSNRTAVRGIIKGEEERCYGFSLFAVPDTNAFILIRTTNHIGCGGVYVGHADNCSCASDLSKNCQTSWNNFSQCECPCNTKDPAYDSCTDTYTFDTNRESIPPCALSEPLDDYTDAVGLYNVSDLPICYEISLDSEQDVTFATTVLATAVGVLILLVLATSQTMFLLDKQDFAKTVPITDEGRAISQEEEKNQQSSGPNEQNTLLN